MKIENNKIVFERRQKAEKVFEALLIEKNFSYDCECTFEFQNTGDCEIAAEQIKDAVAKGFLSTWIVK